MSQSLSVALHTHVEIEMSDAWGETEKLVFDIVPDAQADYYAGYLGEGTPLAKAILGCRVGNVVVYKAGEDACKVRILAVQPAAGEPGGEAEARREAVQQAREQIARTDAMIFASTVEGKWGEYEINLDDGKSAAEDGPLEEGDQKKT